MNKIGLYDWKCIAIKEIDKFYEWWIRNNKTSPEFFPLELETLGEWDEHFSLFKLPDEK